MSLIAWFPLNNNKNNIGEGTYSISNTPSFSSTGKTANYCGSFSTVGSANTYLTSQTLPLNNNSPISIFCWVYMNSYSTTGANLNGIVSNHNHDGNGLGLTLRNNGSSYQVSFSAPVGSTLSSRVFSSIYGATTFTTGSWHHIGMVYNGTDIRLYLDGVEQTIVNNGTNTGKTYFTYTATNGSNNPIGIACWSTSYGSYGSDCKLQDVRVYNHALSNVEIRNLNRALVLHYDFENMYKQVDYIQSSGTQWFDSGITIGANTRIKTKLKINAFASYYFLYGAWSVFALSPRSDNTLCIAGGGTNIQPFPNSSTTYNTSTIYEIDHKPNSFTINGTSYSLEGSSNTTGSGRNILIFAASNSGNTPYSGWYARANIYYFQIYDGDKIVRDYIPVVRKTDGVVGMYDKVNNVFYTNAGSGSFTASETVTSNEILDCSGNGIDGTSSGLTITTSNIGTTAVSFNGSSSKIDTNIPMTTNMTFACWLKFNGTGGYHIIDCRAASGETGTQPMYGGTAYGLQCYSSAGGSYTWSAATCGFTTGTWYHVVVAYTSSNATLYINGVSKGTQSGTFGSNFGTRLMRVGTRCTGANWFNGVISDVRVYNSTLSVSDIQELYNTRFMIDNKGNFYCDGLLSSDDSPNITSTGIAKVNDIGTGANTFSFGGAYTRLDYIQFSGTQFINSGVTSMTAPFKVEIKYNKTNTETSDQCLFGQRQFGKFTNIYNNYYESAFGNSASGSESGDSKIHTVIMDSSSGLYKDGTQLISGTLGNASSSYPALIGAFSEADPSGAKWFFKGQIYKLDIYSNNSLIRSFIPVKRNSDNALGMYDCVNGVFYANSGSGSFTAGTSMGKLATIGCNNFYRDGGACVGKYELTQFGRYQTYTLSISAGTGTNVTVNRTSSPNAGASTGNLSNGASIYTGDTLTISYSVSSGYNISTHTVNGSTFTSGASYTVSSNISVVTTAVVAQSWHTVFSGSQTFNFNANSYGNTTITLSGLKANVPTKVTGTAYKDADLTASGYGTGWYNQPTAYSFSDQSTPYSKTGVYAYPQYSQADILITINTPTSANTFPISRYWGDDSAVVAGCSKLTLTKVEQYY